MGITAILIVLLIITIFLVSKIPKLTFSKKVFIVLAVLLLFIGSVTYIFIKGFEGGRRPNLQEFEIAQEIPSKNKTNSEKENSNQKTESKDSLNEVMSEKDILFNGKLSRHFTVKEFEKTFGKVDSTKLLAEEEPCTFIFDTEPETGSMNDNKYFYKDGSRFENFKEKVAVDEFRFLKNNFILFKGKKLSALTTVSELQKIFPNAVKNIGSMDVYGEGNLQVIQLREDANNVSDGHLNIFLKNGKLYFMHWWFPC